MSLLQWGENSQSLEHYQNSQWLERLQTNGAYCFATSEAHDSLTEHPFAESSLVLGRQRAEQDCQVSRISGPYGPFSFGHSHLQHGKDIIAADPQGRTLWVTVKGFPEKSKNIQARHWFAGALLDLARYKDESEDALLAMGLPQGFSTYEALLRRTQSVRRFLRYMVYWVKSDGTVVLEDAREAVAR